MPPCSASVRTSHERHARRLGGANQRVRVLIGRLALALALSTAVAGHAQELEPRAYSASPAGTNFAIVSYAHASGDVLFDPSLEVTDAQARIDTLMAGYVRTFGLLGRSASLGALLPYVQGSLSGALSGAPTRVYRSGFGDARLRLALNMLGGPALTPEEFATREATTTLGASLSVVAPTGQYGSSRLINIGSNRWAFKPELGLSHPIGNWFVEATAGVWLFTDNTDFFGGNTRSQDPLAAYQLHAGYTFRPGLWIAADATYYTGGETSVNGTGRQDLQENSRYGLTLSIPFNARWSAKLAWATGLTTRIGGNFQTAFLALQYRWFDAAPGR